MRRCLALLLVLLFPTLVAAPARASAFPHTMPLPVDFAPEGIAVGPGNQFYTGSLTKGDIYRGDLRTGEGSVWVDAPSGTSAVGMKVHHLHGLLFVAGGFGGDARVYDTATGALVAAVQLAAAGSTLINDVALSDDAAWFTDSFAAVLHRVPISPLGAIGTPTTLPLTGPGAAVDPNFPNLNGLDVTPDGSTIVLAHTTQGLFTADAVTGATAAIAVDGLALGTLDGILLQGRSLWVVENFANTVARVTLSPDLSTGVITQEVTDEAFQVPTTVARHGSRLVLVNARFDLGFPPPFGPGAPAGTTYDVVVLKP